MLQTLIVAVAHLQIYLFSLCTENIFKSLEHDFSFMLANLFLSIQFFNGLHQNQNYLHVGFSDMVITTMNNFLYTF